MKLGKPDADQSNEETWLAQPKDNVKNKDKNKDKDKTIYKASLHKDLELETFDRFDQDDEETKTSKR